MKQIYLSSAKLFPAIFSTKICIEIKLVNETT